MPFDKDIELKKIDLVSEEIRNRYFTALGVYFALLIAMIAAAFEIGSKKRLLEPFQFTLR